MKMECCRSSPRCASCPVVLAARARGRFVRDRDETLFIEVFAGLPPRELPPCVTDALVQLDERRAEPLPT